MGNLASSDDINCKQQCGELINETKSQIQRFNPFSKIQQQKPYAQPLQTNIFAPNLTTQQLFEKVIQSQPLKVPAQFEKDQSYEYDEKYWKKQQPNIVIQGHWFKRKPHGLCKIFFSDGKTLFISYFNHGQPLFQDCIIIFESGSYYHGSLKNFKFNGQGKYVHYDKSVLIQGQWKNGQPVGLVKQKIVYDDQVIEFDGEFNQEGQKQGQKCMYTIKSTQRQNQKHFQYYGGLKNDSFFGKGLIKINNGHHEMNGMFKNDIIEIQKLQTDDFHFTGKMDKLLNEGEGKIKVKGSRRNTVCQGSMKKGMLNGPGTIINQDGQMQKVHWFNGVKLKHVRNYENHIQLNELLQRIEIYYSTSKSYTEMTKQLEEYFKSHQMQEVVSPRKLHGSYVFEMISKEKANTITMSTRQQSIESHSQGSSGKASSKKQLIIELQKGRFLYVSCFIRQRE